MTTLTIPFRDDLLRKVDEFAKKEERSREELVGEAIEIYLREKAIDELNAHGRRLGITPGVINEEIRQYREEQSSRAQ
ncbi:MAG: ribbon-helix-helix domain-containing protein [Chitinispirillales bacterium]|jgi:metal-responsive CopG/Arc/MetJ family transcriptional regulator|nr:ribbon-helix-helix domain-containing protein [Chitinispirillales bacterium]